MNWIKISEINTFDEIDGKCILIWQENLSDQNCSRFQRAFFYKGNSTVGSFIEIYPLTNIQYYKEDNGWIGHDLEGDKCQITHFALVEPPK